MFAKRNYGFWMTLNWSKKPFIYGLIYTGIVTVVYELCLRYLHINIALPWQPISTLGVAVAFYLGFKNNASYDRTWEARKIWGAIVNNSRSFGSTVKAFIQGEQKEKLVKELIYRHIAWLITLRYQLRLAREWEHTEERLSMIYSPTICEKYVNMLDQDIDTFISTEEKALYKDKTNMATQILMRQTQRLEDIYKEGNIDLFKQLEIQKYIASFYDEQGKSERIKNFPFPRQYASTALWMTTIFSALIPFGMLDIMSGVDPNQFWMILPLTSMTIWVFFLMEMIGDYSENPFEGSYNDVPITSIARGIEIDLREMIDDSHIPGPIKQDEMGFLM
ncbi:MAG: bestrophin family ion channel [Saprospiraceae bacterium]